MAWYNIKDSMYGRYGQGLSHIRRDVVHKNFSIYIGSRKLVGSLKATLNTEQIALDTMQKNYHLYILHPFPLCMIPHPADVTLWTYRKVARIARGAASLRHPLEQQARLMLLLMPSPAKLDQLRFIVEVTSEVPV